MENSSVQNAYETAQATVKQQLLAISLKINENEQNLDIDKVNWSDVGDMNRLVELLTEVEEHLKV